MKLRVAALAALLGLLLSACDTELLELTDEAVPLMAEPMEELQEEAANARFLVDVSLDATFYEGALEFADRVNQLSGGTLDIQVRSTLGAVQGFSGGGGQLVFVDSRTDYTDSEYLSTLATPFLYTSHATFGMAVHAKAITAALEEETGCRMLGAYYQPSRHLVSTWQPTDIDYFNEVRVAVDPDSNSQWGFRRLGAVVAEEPDPAERLELMESGWAQAAEFTLEELEALGWRQVMQESELDLYLTLTYHTAAPVYLMAAPEFYNGLTPVQQAALQEAAAYLYGAVDERYLHDETDKVTLFSFWGMLVNPEDFTDAREIIMTRREDQEDEEELFAPSLQYVIDLVTQLE